MSKAIHLVNGTGRGSTELAAFDSALIAGGIGNYNLIRLSSVISPNTKVVHANQLADDYGNWGDRLYLVYAYGVATKLGEQAWAWVGWVILEENGSGLFVEHEADTEQECRRLMKATLSDLCVSRGHTLEDYAHDYVVVGVTCEDQPAAAVVGAVYKTAGW